MSHPLLEMIAAGCRPDLEKAWAEGRSVHRGIALSYDLFSRETVRRLIRRLERSGDEPAAGAASRLLSNSPAGDLYLAIACDAGVPGAWKVLEKRHLPILVAIARRRGLSHTEAEEISRELPGELVASPGRGNRTRLGAYDGTAGLTSWLGVILVRRIIDRYRSTSPLAVPQPAAFGESEENAARALLSGENRHRIRSALEVAWQKLSDRQALALLLKYRDEVVQKEIAALLGVGEPRVSRLLSAGVEKVRRELHLRLSEAFPGRWAREDDLMRDLRDAIGEHLASLPTAHELMNGERSRDE